MTESPENVGGLVDEYRRVFGFQVAPRRKSLERLLVSEADWTPEAASHLIQLSNAYGSLMLRNALAISLALGIEDGNLGF